MDLFPFPQLWKTSPRLWSPDCRMHVQGLTQDFGRCRENLDTRHAFLQNGESSKIHHLCIFSLTGADGNLSGARALSGAPFGLARHMYRIQKMPDGFLISGIFVQFSRTRVSRQHPRLHSRDERGTPDPRANKHSAVKRTAA